MEIRERHESDLDDLVAVAARVHELDNYPIFLPDDDYIRFLSQPKPLAAWVAVSGRELVGHVALNETTSPSVMELVEERGRSAHPVYVARLLVDPGSRRLGGGRQLLDHARRAVADAGRCPFLDVVDTPTATPAISMYRRAGWEEIGRVRFEIVGDEIEELVFRGPPS